MNSRLTRRGYIVFTSAGVLLCVVVAALFVVLAQRSDDATAKIAGPAPTLAAAVETTGVRESSTMGPAETTTSATSAPTSSDSAMSSTTSTTPSSTSAADPPVVVIDPGHQAKGDHSLEPIGPGSTTKKDKVSDGTAGVTTGVPESRLVLAVSLKLKESLESHGIRVVMTRTSQEVNVSNIERAQIGNRAKADLVVRVHADGSTTSSTTGIHVLYPATIKGWTDDIAKPSAQAAAIMQKRLIAATGAVDRGLDERRDMTGFNWSDVPVVLPEIGFMTNPGEDRLLATAAYQDKIVKGLTQAILEYLEVN
jgi:N-acetylmuramoyl-L-alanine amidase